MENKNLTTIERKLDLITALLYKIAHEGEKMTLKDQVEELLAFGLSSAEIGIILGKKTGHISKEMSALKKK